MNLFDVVVIVLLVVAIIIGVGSGALPQIGGLLGAFGAGAVAIVGLPLFEGPLGSLPPHTLTSTPTKTPATTLTSSLPLERRSSVAAIRAVIEGSERPGRTATR